MSADINSVTVIGRLTKDVEVQQVGESTVSKMSIANNYSKKVNGNWVEEANFFDVTMWGREGLHQYLKKGTRLAVSGELRQDRFEVEGQKRSRVFINANQIELLIDNKPTVETPAPWGN